MAGSAANNLWIQDEIQDIETVYIKLRLTFRRLHCMLILVFVNLIQIAHWLISALLTSKNTELTAQISARTHGN
jgi:hypothetical protein